MKKNILCILICLSLSGCYVQSLNRFYTDDVKKDLPRIEGQWVPSVLMGTDVSDQDITPWTFSTGLIETYDEENRFSELEVGYITIGNNLYLDFTSGSPLPEDAFCGNDYWSVGITRVHSLCKVHMLEDSLEIIPLKLDWFEAQFENNDLNLPVYRADDPDDNVIFTATPEEWVAFLKEYGDHSSLFDADNRFVFRR